MSNDELDKVFTLLRQFYERNSIWENREKQLAYKLALEPYSYDEVRRAVLAHVRRSVYFPFVAELTAALPSPDGDAQQARSADAELLGISDAELLRRRLERLQQRVEDGP